MDLIATCPQRTIRYLEQTVRLIMICITKKKEYIVFTVKTQI